MKWTIALAITLITAVVTPATAKERVTVPVGVDWNDDAVAWAKARGKNTITGSALLRTRGGEARTCAAVDVYLIPSSPYADARMTLIYGADDRGYRSASAFYNVEDPPVGYIKANRSTICDAQGYFTFDQVPDGTYYITSVVTWSVPGRYVSLTQGGGLMAKVTVEGGETKRVMLTSQ